MIPVDELKNMSESTLVSIYRTMNYWAWPMALGDAPDDWEELPNYRGPWMDENCKTKADIIRPYAREIRRILPHTDFY